MGWFRPVHCKSVSAKEMRAVLGTRKMLQQTLIDLELSLRGVLRNFGLEIGTVTRVRFAGPGTGRGQPDAGTATAPVLRAREELREELAGLEKLLRDLAKADPDCRLMMTVPGIGAVVALTMRSAVDDPGRFSSSKDIGPWAGLTPRRIQSGERDVIGQITRAGDAALRTALYQAANAVLCRSAPSWLKAWALRVAARRGRKRATVALARRIGVVLHRMWRDGTEFRFTRPHYGSRQCRAEIRIPLPDQHERKIADRRISSVVRSAPTRLVADRRRTFRAERLQQPLNLSAAQIQYGCGRYSRHPTLDYPAQNFNPVQLARAHLDPSHSQTPIRLQNQGSVPFLPCRCGTF
jgi:hypothetical protein